MATRREKFGWHFGGRGPLGAALPGVLVLALVSGLAQLAVAADLALLGRHASYASLSVEERAAYDWALGTFDAEYLHLDEVAANADVLDAYKTVWWHYDESVVLPGQGAAATAIRDWVDAGGRVLLSGFATQYVLALGFEDTEPTMSRSPGTSGAWGFTQKTDSAAFDGMPEVFATLAPGLSVDNVISWWEDPAEFDGIWLADTEWQGQIVAMGEYRPGNGRVVVVGTGAYEFEVGGWNGKIDVLRTLTMNILRSLRSVPKGDLLARFTMEDLNDQQQIKEWRTGLTAGVPNNFGRPEFAPGPWGEALRADGYSTFVDFAPGVVEQATPELTVSAWVAARAFPYQEDAAIVNQHEAPRGFFLGVDPWGAWNFSVGADGNWHSVGSPAPLPKFQWVHVAGTYNRHVGLRLYLNGGLVGENLFSAGDLDPAASVPFQIGRHNRAGSFGIFPLGVFNGLIDEVRVHDRALSGDEIRVHYESGSPPVAEIIVPASRFAHDPTRPGWHAIPPADWTNEPHGLIYYRGNYHLFHQKNPNGPYFGNQHWGHLISSDFANWYPVTDAIWPQASYDRNGTWSGTTTILNNGLAILYTSNDQGQSQSVATSGEDLAINFHKWGENPVLPALPPDARPGILGFRDPFVWRDGAWYYTIIGSGYEDTGGEVHLYRSTNLLHWEYRGIMFSRPPDIVNHMWEMPMFGHLGNGQWIFLVNAIPAPGHPGPVDVVYWIGKYENERFVPDAGFATPRKIDKGPEHVLAPSISYTADGRMYVMGVMIEDRTSEAQLAAGYANLFSMPRMLTLGSDGDLRQAPAPELEVLRGQRHNFTNILVPPGESDFLPGIGGDMVEIRILADLQGASAFGIKVRKSPNGQEQTLIQYNAVGGLFIKRALSSTSNQVGKWDIAASHQLQGSENLELRIFVDRSSIELFANRRTVMTGRIYPQRWDSVGLDLYSQGGTAKVISLDVWPLGNDPITPTPTATPTPTPPAPKGTGWMGL